MWAVANNTPFAVERAGARDRDGAEVWLVGVKATFTLLDDGGTQLAEEQEPVWMAPAFHGDPAATSMTHETDLAWGKPGTDVLVTGSAHAPDARLVTQLPVAFALGPVLRQVVILGDRVWERGVVGLREGPPRPFTAMPLLWERAFGGSDMADHSPAWEPRNPVGCGFNRLGRPPLSSLANIEDPRARIASPWDRPVPMGFGPVGRHWQPRAAYAGTYDAVWMRERRPLLPLDYDPRFQFAAPAEQQVPGHLRGGEELKLLHLHPRVARYRTVLPQVDLGFHTRFRSGATEEHRARLTSVTVNTDLLRLTMVWVSELPCHHTIQRLLETEVSLIPRVRVPAGSRPAAPL